VKTPFNAKSPYKRQNEEGKALVPGKWKKITIAKAQNLHHPIAELISETNHFRRTPKADELAIGFVKGLKPLHELRKASHND
jgi:hypothetical protein